MKSTRESRATDRFILSRATDGFMPTSSFHARQCPRAPICFAMLVYQFFIILFLHASIGITIFEAANSTSHVVPRHRMRHLSLQKNKRTIFYHYINNKRTVDSWHVAQQQKAEAKNRGMHWFGSGKYLSVGTQTGRARCWFRPVLNARFSRVDGSCTVVAPENIVPFRC